MSEINVNNPGTMYGTQIGDRNQQTNYFQQEEKLVKAAAKIEELLTQWQNQGYSSKNAQERVVTDLVTRANSDSDFKKNLVEWGQLLRDRATGGIISGIVVEVIKLTLKSVGIPLP